MFNAFATFCTVRSEGFLLPRSKPLMYVRWTPKIFAIPPCDSFLFRRASLSFLPNFATSFVIKEFIHSCIDFIKCCIIGLWIAIIQHTWGVNLLCAHGRVGQTQLHIFLRRILRSKIRNSAAAEKRGRAKNSFPPTPFLFARPSVRFRSCRAKRGNQSEFRSKKVRAAFSNCDN